MIELAGVSKSFGSARAVHEMSFSLEPGTITGFLGPNGAGKTTTMRLITGYLQPDVGTVRVAGKSHEKDGALIRASLGYLPEHTPLYDDLTVLEHLSLTGRLHGLRSENLRLAIGKMARACDLEDRLKQTVGTLSRGYRQRVGLAQAMIHDPDILILDEPTTGLDPNQTADMKDLLLELGTQKTLLLSTHILQQVPDLCDRVLVISKGSLVFDGTPVDLLTVAGDPNAARLTVDQEAEIVIPALTKLDCVKAVKQIGKVDAFVHYRLEGRFSGEDMATVFAELKARDWRVRGFSAEDQPLETIFSQLTEGAA